jgi:hypothetical protein
LKGFGVFGAGFPEMRIHGILQLVKQPGKEADVARSIRRTVLKLITDKRKRRMMKCMPQTVDNFIRSCVDLFFEFRRWLLEIFNIEFSELSDLRMS